MRLRREGSGHRLPADLLLQLATWAGVWVWGLLNWEAGLVQVWGACCQGAGQAQQLRGGWCRGRAQGCSRARGGACLSCWVCWGRPQQQRQRQRVLHCWQRQRVLYCWQRQRVLHCWLLQPLAVTFPLWSACPSARMWMRGARSARSGSTPCSRDALTQAWVATWCVRMGGVRLQGVRGAC